VVSIGGNDVAAATDLCIELQDAVDCPNDVVVPLAVDRLEQEVRRLLDETSATVLLTNVPNIALTPRFDEPGKVQQADALTNRFTGLLAGRVEQLLQEYENRIIYFDLYQNHTQLLENTTEGEFANVTDACGDLALGYDKNYDGEIDTDDLDLDTLLFVTTELNIVTNYTFEGDCTADTINQYFYYDSFHGTEAAYRLLGNGLIDAVCPRDGLRMTPAMIHGICPE
jgi:phospholipase/lecithinase/hemolysin